MRKTILSCIAGLIALVASCHSRGVLFSEEEKSVVDCSSTKVLEDFDDEQLREALFRHLCASSRWRVTKRAGVVVAQKRCPSYAGSCDTTIRFSSALPKRPIRVPTDSVAEAGAKNVEVSMSKSTDATGALMSCLLVRSKHLGLSITEAGAGRRRILTETAMTETAEELKGIKENATSVLRDGYFRKLIPDESIRESDKDLPIEIREGSHAGIYWVTGYVNAAEKGYTSIRTFDEKTGEEVAREKHAAGTIEYVGWSSRHGEKFFFRSEVSVDGDGGEKEIRFEIWFHGKEERKLLETTQTVRTWKK